MNIFVKHTGNPTTWRQKDINSLSFDCRVEKSASPPPAPTTDKLKEEENKARFI
jgi:hypothetical protein